MSWTVFVDERENASDGFDISDISDISDHVRDYHEWVEEQVQYARKLQHVEGTQQQLEKWNPDEKESMTKNLGEMQSHWKSKLDALPVNILENWEETFKRYQADHFEVQIRDKTIKNELYRESLSGLKIPRVSLPKYEDYGERLRFALKENLPGYFPFTAGVYPFKREGEDPTRMFAGEGTPERTNKRFHYVSEGMPAARLSTAFDSVTLYGEDPGYRPDIYGKIGNSGVSICCLDDAKKLYSGFNLADPKTSVSMTINGPAATITSGSITTSSKIVALIPISTRS